MDSGGCILFKIIRIKKIDPAPSRFKYLLYRSIYKKSQKIFYILLIILSAFIGDIIESFFKRKNNLKNSSEFVPGHGGVFDRFDSFLFSIIIYAISNTI